MLLRSMMPPRRLLPVSGMLLLLPALAACGSSTSAGDRVLGAKGSVVDSVRGSAAGADVLRPEPGNIWSEGLEPARVPPGR